MNEAATSGHPSVFERTVMWSGIVAGGTGLLVCVALDLEGALAPGDSPSPLFLGLLALGLVAVLVATVTRTRDVGTVISPEWPSLLVPSPTARRLVRLVWWVVVVHAGLWVLLVVLDVELLRPQGLEQRLSMSSLAGAVFKPFFWYLLVYHLFGRDRMFPRWRMAIRANPGYWLGRLLGRAVRGRGEAEDE